MLKAGIPIEQAHRHMVTHTFGGLDMAELSRVQRIMGHVPLETTRRYVDRNLAAEHTRIERLRGDPLARRQRQRRGRAAGRR